MEYGKEEVDIQIQGRALSRLWEDGLCWGTLGGLKWLTAQDYQGGQGQPATH